MRMRYILIMMLAVQLHATTYYLSPAGSDASVGTQTAPWLSPNHAINCGDVIVAAAGSYNSANFTSGKWGAVSCPGGNNVAWLQCAAFDGCKIAATMSGSAAIWVDKSYWGVQGWEATTASSMIYSGCFTAMPAPSATATIHHIIFANNVANGCQAQGFGSSNRGAVASVDYLAVIGNVAYNAAQASTECYSGISVNQPVQSDALPGTHIYVAGNFSYSNYDSAACDSNNDTDGEGIIFDTFDNQLGGSLTPYAAQALADNNVIIGNGGRGISVVDNDRIPYAMVYIRHNTIWSNNLDTHQNGSWCGELYLQNDSGVTALDNLIVTGTATGCGSNPTYSVAVGASDVTNHVSGNFLYSVNGSAPLSASNTGFTYGTNVVGVNPSLTAPTVPSAPACSTYINVPACMAQIVSALVPKAVAATGYGYQTPSAAIYDSLFPQWLCSVNLPTGLVTMGCAATPISASVLQRGTYTLAPGSTITITAAGSVTVQ